MFINSVYGILAAPWRGLIVSLAVLPMIAVFAAMAVGAVTAFGVSNPEAASIVLQLILALIMFFGVYATVTQTVRYAGSFARAIPLSEQIGFWSGFWRTVVISLVFSILIGLIYFAALVILQSLGMIESIDETLNAHMQWELAALSDTPDAANSVGKLLYQVLYVATSMMLAWFLLPACCGMGAPYSEAWQTAYVLLRVFFALPFLLIALAVLSTGLGWVLEILLAGVEDGVEMRFGLQRLFESWFAGCMAYTAEAGMLAAAWRTAERRYERQKTSLRGPVMTDLRSMRRERMGLTSDAE